MGTIVLTFIPISATAVLKDTTNSVTNTAHGQQVLNGSSNHNAGHGSGGSAASGYNGGPTVQEIYEAEMAEYAKEKRRIDKINTTKVNNYGACLEVKSSLFCPPPVVVPLPRQPTAPDGAAADPIPVGATMPPVVVAYSAIVEWGPPPPRPVIGPPPRINPWKMAAVGYPLWLSASGNLDPAPVSQTVYDLTVSLDARLNKVIFDMGDGQRVTCTDPSYAWHTNVKPGTASPTCGYRYEKPSLPRGNYTITATTYWDVAWRTNNATGTLPFVQEATTTLPVGELQVLVR